MIGTGLFAGEVGVAVSTEHPFLCRALVGDLGRATRLPDLAEALRSAFYEPIEKLLAEAVAVEGPRGDAGETAEGGDSHL